MLSNFSPLIVVDLKEGVDQERDLSTRQRREILLLLKFFGLLKFFS